MTEKGLKFAFFAIFGLILAVSGPVFPIFSPDVTKKNCCLAVHLQKSHRCRSFDPVFSLKDPYLTEICIFGSKIVFFFFFAIFGLILAVPGPVFSIFSPDMTKKKRLFGSAAAKNSPLPFF